MQRPLYLMFALSQLLRGGLDPRKLSLRWSELNGTRIEGKVAAVQPEGLPIGFTKHRPGKFSQGERSCCLEPRFSGVQVVSRWRILGTAIGPITVGAAGAVVPARGAGTVNDLLKYTGCGAAPVDRTGIVRYDPGKRADRRVTTIRIVL